MPVTASTPGAMAGGNGSSGRVVVDDVLTPLGVAAEATYFTDCLPHYFVKYGAGSQGARIAEVYSPFAPQIGRLTAELPERPSEKELVQRSLSEEANELRRQLLGSGPSCVVTLGQEAADVFAGLTETEAVKLVPGPGYGAMVPATLRGKHFEWLPLTHPGNRTLAWRTRHQQWMQAQGTAA